MIRHRLLIVLSVSTAGLLLASVWLPMREAAVAQESSRQERQEESTEPPPLVVDRSDPLLLEEPEEEPRSPWEVKGPKGADNGPCYVCHANYEDEPMAEWHRKAGIGCTKCHGESLAHRNDEDNVTPPETMYWPERIDPACSECHKDHDVPARDVLARWGERCPEKTDAGAVVCTDCHGQHRLKFRTVWWNKRTGELVVREEGQRVKRRDEVPGPGEASSE